MTNGGSIVCVTAPGAAQIESGLVAHNIAAGAITELARSLAVALAPYDIRANAAAPATNAGAPIGARGRGVSRRCVPPQ